MDDDAVPLPDPARPLDRDVNRNGLSIDARRGKPASATPDSPDLCRAQVTEYGAVTAGQYGRHPVRTIAEPGMANGINTAMNAVQAARLDAPGDGLTAHADGFELAERDHAVLSASDPRDLLVVASFGAFLTHVGE